MHLLHVCGYLEQGTGSLESLGATPLFDNHSFNLSPFNAESKFRSQRKTLFPSPSLVRNIN